MKDVLFGTCYNYFLKRTPHLKSRPANTDWNHKQAAHLSRN